MKCPHCKKEITGLIGEGLCDMRVTLNGETPTTDAYLSFEDFEFIKGTTYFCKECGTFLTNSDDRAIYIMRVVDGLIEDNGTFKVEEGEMANYD